MYDSRTRLAQDVVMQVKSYFKDVVFNTIIPRNVRLSEAPSHGDQFVFTTRIVLVPKVIRNLRKR